MNQRLPQTHNAVEPLAVVFRLPGFVFFLLFVHHRGIEHYRSRTHTLVHRRGIDDRLERGPGLTAREHRTIVFTARKIIPADHRADGARFGIDRNQSAFNQRGLLQAQMHNLLLKLLHPDLDDITQRQQLLDILDRNGILGGILAFEILGYPGHIVEGQPTGATADLDQHVIFGDLRHHPFHDIPLRKLHRGIGCRHFQSRQIDGAERTAPALTLIDLAQSMEHSGFSRFLHIGIQRGEHFQSTLVHHRFTELGHQQLPDILHEIGPEMFTARTAEVQLFGYSLLTIGGTDKTRLGHPAQHMLLPLLGPVIGLKGGVVAGGFGKTGEKRRFSQREL